MVKLLIAANPDAIHATNDDGDRPKDEAKTEEVRALLEAAETAEGLARVQAEVTQQPTAAAPAAAVPAAAKMKPKSSASSGAASSSQGAPKSKKQKTNPAAE